LHSPHGGQASWFTAHALAARTRCSSRAGSTSPWQSQTSEQLQASVFVGGGAFGAIGAGGAGFARGSGAGVAGGGVGVAGCPWGGAHVRQTSATIGA